MQPSWHSAHHTLQESINSCKTSLVDTPGPPSFKQFLLCLTGHLPQDIIILADRVPREEAALTLSNQISIFTFSKIPDYEPEQEIWCLINKHPCLHVFRESICANSMMLNNEMSIKGREMAMGKQLSGTKLKCHAFQKVFAQKVMPKSLVFVKGAAMQRFLFSLFIGGSRELFHFLEKPWVWKCSSIRLAELGTVTLLPSSGQIYFSLCSHQIPHPCIGSLTHAKLPYSFLPIIKVCS